MPTLPTHHICLVAESPMPTLGPLLDKSIGAKSTTLLFTPYTKPYAEQQATVLEKHGIKTDLIALPDPYHLQPLIDCMTPLATQHQQGACINITGGSKLMSIAAWQVFNQPQHHLYYVHLHQDSIIWLNHDQADHPISDSIKLPDYFAAHGYVVTGNSATPAHPNLMLFARVLASGSYQKELQQLISVGIAQSKQGSNLIIPFNNDKKTRLLINEIVEANLGIVKQQHLHLDDANAWRFLTGEWLEQFTLDCVLQLKSQYPKFQDIAIGLKVTNPKQVFFNPTTASQQTLANELDIVVLRDNTLYVIECKAGKKFPNEADNYTTKLDSIRDTLGGIKGKGLIISQYALTPSSEKRAAEYRIKTLSGSQAIKNLKAQLAEWLGCNLQ